MNAICRLILFALALALLALPASARLGMHGPSPTCIQGGAGDGCAQAPIAQVIFPSLLTTAAVSGQTFVSPPFAGVVSGGVLTVSGVPANTAATASWAVNATSIQIPSGLTLPNNLLVYDSTSATMLGSIKSYSGTTLTFNTALRTASSGATDALVFEVIAGGEVLSGCFSTNNVYVSSNGSGTGGNGTYNLANASGVSASCLMTATRRVHSNMACVDYACGNITPVAQMNDPVNCASIAACNSWCIYYASTGVFSAPGLKCTMAAALNYTVTQFNFAANGSHGCVALYIYGDVAGAFVLIHDNNFDNDANCGGALYYSAWFQSSATNFTWEVSDNSFNGESQIYRWNTSATNTAKLALNVGGCGEVKYNSFVNFQSRTISFVGYPPCPMNFRNNLMNGWSSSDGGNHPEMVDEQNFDFGCLGGVIFNDDVVVYPVPNIGSVATLATSLSGGYVCGNWDVERNTTITNLPGGQGTLTGEITSGYIGISPGSPNSVLTVNSVSAGTVLGVGDEVGETFGVTAIIDNNGGGLAGNTLTVSGSCPAGTTIGVGNLVSGGTLGITALSVSNGSGSAGNILLTSNGPALTVGMNIEHGAVSIGTITGGSGNSWTISSSSNLILPVPPATSFALVGGTAITPALGIHITALGTGTGCDGTYTVDNSAQLVPSPGPVTIWSLANIASFIGGQVGTPGGGSTPSTWNVDQGFTPWAFYDLNGGWGEYTQITNQGITGTASGYGMVGTDPGSWNGTNNGSIAGTFTAKDNVSDMTALTFWVKAVSNIGGCGTSVFLRNYDMVGIYPPNFMNQWQGECP